LLRWVAASSVLWALVAACRESDDDLPLNPRPEEDPSFDGRAGADGSQTGSGGSGGSAPIGNGGGGGSAGSGGSGGGAGAGGVSPGPVDADAGAPPDAGPPSDGGTTDASSDG
jgi:hypothetical protein